VALKTAGPRAGGATRGDDAATRGVRFVEMPSDLKLEWLIQLARNAGGWMGCGQAEAGTRPVVLPAERGEGAEPGGVRCPYSFIIGV
jgi:hypothetical protein